MKQLHCRLLQNVAHLNPPPMTFSNSIFIKTLIPKSPLLSPQFKPYIYYNSTRTHSFSPNSNVSNTFNFLRSHSLSQSSNSQSPSDPFARITSASDNKPAHWTFTFDGVDNGDARTVHGSEEPIVTVVLLGWLGSKQKHLRRYAELYQARGIHAVTFVAPVREMISVDLGRRFIERISGLVVEMSAWLSEKDKDGRERFLMFHTFSNTGWLAYGAILDELQGRPDILERIKGCVFDSGGDPNIDPKVWAAGFAAALLKKRSSAAYSSVEAGKNKDVISEVSMSKSGPKEPLRIEIVLLALLEKLFSFLLNMPELNQKLTKIISGLSKNQPHCPQLYLYSSDDKVIPYKSIESFIEEQTKMGKTVHSFNFETSPHVDHYRTYPSMYSSQLQRFLTECLDPVKQM